MIKKDIPVGIDLGTTFSAIAYLDNDGRPITVTNSEGELTTASVVFFDDDAIIVGSEASFAGEGDVSRLARAAKRDMGSQEYRKKVLDRQLPPEVIQALVLRKLKSDAELRLGPFKKAVITVPAYFNEPRRKATQDAGELAGLEVIDIINEPTAAALAYGIQRGFLNEKGEAIERELVLVYDLGGGTFDVTLMEIVGSQFNTIATAGDVYLGGIDWDARLYEYARDEIEKQNGVDLSDDANLQERLLSQCVRAKKTLSSRTETTIRIDNNGQRFIVSVTRAQFEELTADLLERTRLTTEKLLRDAKTKWTELTKLILVGGSTRMPMVMKMLEGLSGVQVDRSLSPDEAVAHGAAVYAGILLKHGGAIQSNLTVANVNSHDLGVLGIDPETRKPRRKILIPNNHRLPSHVSKKFQTSKDGQQKIVVQIVEGGTDEGFGGTIIGKCIVSDLPASIRRGEEVVVSFNYSTSGRLEVMARIPCLKLKADTTIDRSAGMNAAELEIWLKRLESGAAFLKSLPEVERSAETKEANEPAIAKKTTLDSRPSSTPVPPSSSSQAKRTTRPSADSSNAAKKSPAPDVAAGKQRSVPLIQVPVGLDDDEEFESSEHSGIFVFGDEDPKPLVGASVLGILSSHTGPAGKPEVSASALDLLEKADPEDVNVGESALDFLSDGKKKAATMNDSALEEFLKDLDK